jgi:hypothetical protein
MQSTFEKTPDAEKLNVVQLVQPWTAIVDGLVFWQSSQYEHIDRLVHQQNLGEEHLDALWSVLSTYQPYSVEPALLLLKRESFPRCTVLAKNLLWSLKRVSTANNRTRIDPSISSDDLMRFLVSLENNVVVKSAAYKTHPRPSAKPGRVGGVVFENVMLPGYCDLKKAAESAEQYSRLPLPEELAVSVKRFVHCFSAVYMVLHQIDGLGPEISFVNVQLPVNGMLVLRSARERSMGFDYLYTLFLDEISAIGFLPRVKLVENLRFDGLQSFSACLNELVADKTIEDWQWLRHHFESSLAGNDPRSLLPLIVAAIDHFSEGKALPSDVLKKAGGTRFYMD